MSEITSPKLTFSDGNTIPQLGFGVWQVQDDVAERVVTEAFEAGYRHIDTARIYGNEAGVGRAIKASGLSPEELFITTKIWNADHGYDNALRAFDASMERLGLDTLDLLLIHWLVPAKGKHVETWKALVELQKQGRVKSIGVSNFSIPALDEIVAETGVSPVIHQLETHPHFQQREIAAYEAKHNILHESYSPLGSGKGLLDEPVFAEIGARVGATPAQVVIAWHLAKGFVVIPKSVTSARIRENFEAVNVTLSAEDIALIDALDKDTAGRVGADPLTANFE
ncbi:aldo/keto reductase [Neomicrococcus aestuarii]|uniref:2,5-diketo-D-gluconate reductase A n=1 Tax=Neomicrococcus aestuarii TaxID=556325 RepID=A0A1L2ZNR5_9MICC|nr:aldo/keto reductase [Neomicrococcus aestuarii]APF40672.1 oxidoreductase [Neomicrococcus aestuarii]MBB5512382.1 2,5-diketo-D-gluconate reductase A [Neomicrococcus aestuarii]